MYSHQKPPHLYTLLLTINNTNMLDMQGSKSEQALMSFYIKPWNYEQL
jgi:hypothetical protein